MNMKEVKRTGNNKLSQTLSDKIIGVFSPKTAFERLRYRAATQALTGGYKGADKSRRATKKWSAGSGSADADTLPYLNTLRARSRDLCRNAPLACGAINTVVTNTVGTGLIPQSQPDKEYLLSFNISEEEIDNFTKAAEREFWFWASSRHCDASGTQNFLGLQLLALRCSLESGDAFTIRRMISNPTNPYKTALQIIEADRVENPSGYTQDTEDLSAGVKKGKYGRAEGYYFLKNHPGHLRMVKGRYETNYIPAYFPNGEWQVLHHFVRLRPEQTRGVPYLAPVIEAFKQLERYTEAEIDAAVIAAMFTVFVKTEDGEGLASMREEGGSAPDSENEVALGNGVIVDLARGEEIDIANPGRPNAAFDPFVLAVLRQIGVALEIPFELLVKHFTASYSAAQAAILEAWKFFCARRIWLRDSFCDPCWEAVISEGVATGRIVAPGFFSDQAIRRAWLQAEWTGPPRGVIDIRKETEAYALMEDRQWMTSAQITAQLTGGDWQANANRRADEQTFRRSHKLLPDIEKAQAVNKPEKDEEVEKDEEN